MVLKIDTDRSVVFEREKERYYFTLGPTEIIVLKCCFSDSFRCVIYNYVSFIWRRLIFFEVLCLLSSSFPL